MTYVLMLRRSSGDLLKRTKRSKSSSKLSTDHDYSTTSLTSCEQPTHSYAVPIHAYSNNNNNSSSISISKQHAGSAASAAGKDPDISTNSQVPISSRSSGPTPSYMLNDSSSNTSSSIFSGAAAASAASAAAAAAANVLRFNVAFPVSSSTASLPLFGTVKKGVNTVALDMTTMCKR